MDCHALLQGIFPTQGSNPCLLHWQVDSLPLSVCSVACCVQPFVAPWTVARQAPLSTGFSRKEYWRGLPCPSPGDLPDPGIKPLSLLSPALTVGFFTTSTTWEAHEIAYLFSSAVVLALAPTLASSHPRTSPFLHLIGLARLPVVHCLLGGGCCC